MDEDLFTLEEDITWEQGTKSKEEMLNQEFTLADDDILKDAEGGLFDAEESLW
jgi:hypothetical protein